MRYPFGDRFGPRARYECPNGHGPAAWRPADDGIFCRRCDLDPDCDRARHDRVHDRRSGIPTDPEDIDPSW